MSDLLERVESGISSQGLIPSPGRIVVAVSGGLDSMVLLRVLHQLAPRFGWALCVAHFNHQLRGISSDEDEAFVIGQAHLLGLPVQCARADVRQEAKAARESIEMAGRRLRHSFLVDSAKSFSAQCVALAHHQDDQIEHFFVRLLRGAGNAGLAGMSYLSPSSVNAEILLVRPLLDVSRRELELFAHDQGIAFRDDISNASREFMRNRIRHELLPLLRREYQPALGRVIIRAMEIARGEDEFARGAAEEWLQKGVPSFSELAQAVQRQLMAIQLHRIGITPDFELIELLRLYPGKRVCVGVAMCIFREESGRVCQSDEELGFRSERVTVSLSDESGSIGLGGVRIAWKRQRLADPMEKLVSEPATEYFDADKVGNLIELRHWRPGDRFQPIGMASPVKLQDLFTNLKVPAASRRERVIAATSAGEIFWVEGIRMAERFKLDKGTICRLKWHWKHV